MSKFLAQWKQATQPIEIELEGGTALIRPTIRLQDLVVSGAIPLPLLAAVSDIDREEDGSVKVEDVPTIMPVIDAVAIAAFVDPKVTKDGGEDSIALIDVSQNDRITVFTRVIGGVRALEPFREESGQPDNPARDGDDLPPEAEPDTSD